MSEAELHVLKQRILEDKRAIANSAYRFLWVMSGKYLTALLNIPMSKPKVQ